MSEKKIITKRAFTLNGNLISVISLLAFVLIWELVCRLGIVSPHALVPPTEIINTFIFKWTNTTPDGATLPTHIKTSLLLAFFGFLLAAIIGVPLGLLMGWYKIAEAIITPIFDLIRPIPPIAWIPLVILWLGIGMPAKAFVIWIAAFVPCVINSYTGIRLVNPVLVRVAKIYGASDWEAFRKIGVPASIPMVFTGLKLALNASWTTLVAAELLAASAGLGYLIQMGRRLASPELIIVGMLVIGLLGAMMSALLNWFEGKFASSGRF